MRRPAFGIALILMAPLSAGHVLDLDAVVDRSDG